ncbi:hypothetical protein XENOCAPTIV_011759 [Xenoophorus captivus]|uniref:Uncharacterized protein n=1 Tax=Xenoophorus captivus TaxID=1517983 RepID=A0ABV0RVZ0_9TELE
MLTSKFTLHQVQGESLGYPRLSSGNQTSFQQKRDYEVIKLTDITTPTTYHTIKTFKGHVSKKTPSNYNVNGSQTSTFNEHHLSKHPGQNFQLPNQQKSP